MTDNSTAFELDSLLREAEAARQRNANEDALNLYKRALMVSTPDDVLERASIYAFMGDTKRAQAKPREAELNYEKSLGVMAGYKPAIQSLVSLLESEKDFRRGASYRKKLAQVTIDDDEKVDVLIALADALIKNLDDKRAAVEVLEEAYQLRAGHSETLTRLRDLYETLNRWPKVVEMLGDICRETDDPKERAPLRFQQADITLGRIRDEVRGIKLLEAVLEEDPAHERAFSAYVSVRTKRSEWHDLEREYARLIDRHAERSDIDRAYDVCKRLAILRRDKLGDGPGAVDAFIGALKLRPNDADTRGALAELYIARGDPDFALAELERAAQAAPLRAQTHRRLFEIHIRRGNHDRAYLAALSLEELGAADIDHQIIVDQFKPSNALRPTSALDEDSYDSWLRAPGADPIIEGVMRAIKNAAVEAKLEERKAEKKHTELDPFKKQDPKSTVTMVRTFAWASQIFDIPMPDVYALNEVPNGIAAVQAGHPSIAVGPAVLRDQSIAELAFYAGRHLTYYRPEHYALVYYPTLPELTALFLTAIEIALPDLPLPGNKAMGKLKASLQRNLGDDKETLIEAAKRFESAGGRVDLAQWIRSVELTAHRAAVLLCGDFHVAMRIIKGEARRIADVTMEERRADVLAYMASSGLTIARQTIGIGANPVKDSDSVANDGDRESGSIDIEVERASIIPPGEHGPRG